MQARIKELEQENKALDSMNEWLCETTNNQLKLIQEFLIGRTGRIKLRGDSGPSGELSEPMRFRLVRGRYYEEKWILSAPGLRGDQIQWDDPEDASEPSTEPSKTGPVDGEPSSTSTQEPAASSSEG